MSRRTRLFAATVAFAFAVTTAGSGSAAAAGASFVDVGVDSSERHYDPNVVYPTMSSDAKTVAFVGLENRWIYVRDLASGKTRHVATCSKKRDKYSRALCDLRLSANGRHLAFTSDKKLVSDDTNDLTDAYRMDLTNRKVVLASAHGLTGKAGGGLRPRISADGSLVSFDSQGNLDGAYSSTAEQVYARDVAAGKTRLVSVGGGNLPASGHDSEMSANGRWFVFTVRPGYGISGSGWVALKDMNSSAPAVMLDEHLGYPVREGNHFAEFSAPTNSGRIAVRIEREQDDASWYTEFDDSRVFVADFVAKKVLRIVKNHGRAVSSPTALALSADGKTLAFRYKNAGMVAGDTNKRADAFFLNVYTGKVTSPTLTWCKPSKVRNFNCELDDFVLSADGKTLLVQRITYPKPKYSSAVVRQFLIKRG